MSDEPNQKSKRLALVVDDEESLRNIMTFDLQTRGFDARTAESVEAAIDLMSALAFEVVITDLKFPKASGLSLVQWVNLRTGPLPGIIVISGQVESETRKDLIAGGVGAILEKPYLQAEFDEALRLAFASRSTGRPS